MATTWDNGVDPAYTLPNPSAGRTLGARLRVDSIAPQTVRVPMKWSMATAAERTDIKAAYDACAHLISTLTLEDGDSFSVIAFQNGMVDRKWFAWDDTPYYRIELVFDEVE